MFKGFSWQRLSGLILKEFRQFKRDRGTFALVIGVPILQLLFFGLAINTNPRHLPAAVINYDNGPFGRSLQQGLANTAYFDFRYALSDDMSAKELMLKHKALFILTVPPDFSRQLIQGQHPSAVLQVDGTDPVSVAYAISASNGAMPTLFQHDLVGPLAGLKPVSVPADLRIQTLYNPSGITQYNIVPGLLGIVLTMTFVMVASMALTRERELGTLETLLSTPILPIEVMLGKATPFLIVGYLQVFIVLLLAVYLFHVPFVGNAPLLILLTLPFILSCLAVGITISTLANTQLEASQMSIVYFLPALLLTGFAFPFAGMPEWAQAIGRLLPVTHYIYIIRGIMLKGISLTQALGDIWQILLFLLVVLAIALKRYRRTLD